MRRVSSIAAAALAASVVMSACQSESDVAHNAPSKQHDMANSPAAGAAQNTEANPVLPPHKDAPGSRVGGVATAETQIDLLEYRINMPSTLKAGPHKFAVSNAGYEQHSVVIEGNGIKATLPAPLPGRGNSATLEVNLTPGTYRVYCPVEGHPGKGMETTLTVQ